MTNNSAVSNQQNGQPSTFGERLAFAIWLAGKVLGVQNAKDFADVLGKGQSQLSRWLREDPRPEWPNIKQIAEAVGISALWLDDPSSRGADEPELFAEWYNARVRRQEEIAAKRAGQRAQQGRKGTPAVKSSDVRKRA